MGYFSNLEGVKRRYREKHPDWRSRQTWAMRFPEEFKEMARKVWRELK